MMGKTDKTAALHNLGCKVNACETEAMREMLEAAGYRIVDFAQPADVYVVNTCTVTQVADHKSRQMLNRARKRNPDAVVVACGCYVDSAFTGQHPEDGADIYIGNNEKGKLLELVEEFRRDHKPIVSIHDMMQEREYEPLKVHLYGGRARAFLKVQDGCNRFCSYCIIPYVRGRVRSSRPEEILSQVKDLAKDNVKEIVLDGIHLTSYGEGIGLDLADLAGQIAQVPGIERVRLGSLEPNYITEETAAKLAAIKGLCPHFHLSLQSGCDSVLGRMHRPYTSAEFEEKCRILRKAFDRPAITTDVIAGFPGETLEEHQATLEFLERVSLYEIHVFPYSLRKGTRAAAMPGQVPKKEKQRRAGEILELTKRQKKEFEDSFLGEEKTVLVEQEVFLDGKRVGEGHTPEYLEVSCNGKPGCLCSGTLSRDPASGRLVLRG